MGTWIRISCGYCWGMRFLWGWELCLLKQKQNLVSYIWLVKMISSIEYYEYLNKHHSCLVNYHFIKISLADELSRNFIVIVGITCTYYKTMTIWHKFCSNQSFLTRKISMDGQLANKCSINVTWKEWYRHMNHSVSDESHG